MADNREFTPHDHKGYSEERCLRCGWTMGHPPLNCMNDDTPHVFVSQVSMGGWFPAAIDAAHLGHQREWSRRTFGPGPRTLGVLDHIRKELVEVEDDPTGAEWVDVIILAFDGILRAGWEPQQIIDAIKLKQAKNEDRTWPDWRTMSADRAIEHDRSAE